MRPEVCLVCIKEDFATTFIDFAEAKISVHDSFHFGTKTFQENFCILWKFGFSIGLAFFYINNKNMYQQLFHAKVHQKDGCL